MVIIDSIELLTFYTNLLASCIQEAQIFSI